MRIKATERAIRLFEENKEILYSSVITVVILMFFFTTLLLKDGMDVCQNAAYLMFIAGLTAFNCVCACAMYKMKAEKDYSIHPVTSFFLAAVAALATTIVYFVAETLFGEMPAISYHLLAGLVAMGAFMLVAGIMSIHMFSIMTE